MSIQIQAEFLTREAFAPFGDVIEKKGYDSFPINRGKCQRHHALSTAEVMGDDARVIMSIFAGQAYQLPHRVDLVERHPLGSQAFYPLGNDPWLVIVCADDNGVLFQIVAFTFSVDNQKIRI